MAPPNKYAVLYKNDTLMVSGDVYSLEMTHRSCRSHRAIDGCVATKGHVCSWVEDNRRSIQQYAPSICLSQVVATTEASVEREDRI